MTWICDICHCEMEVTNEGENRNYVYCSNCGAEWYVDDDGNYIN